MIIMMLLAFILEKSIFLKFNFYMRDEITVGRLLMKKNDFLMKLVF